MSRILFTVFTIGLLIMQFCALAGQYYLTQFSFKSTSVGDARTLVLTDTQLGLTRLAIVLFWILFAWSIGLGLFATLQ